MRKLLMIFTMLMAASVFADTWTDPATGIEWTYTVKNGEATVGDWENYLRAVPESTSGAIAIPVTLGGCPVTRIGESAFAVCERLTSVTIPSSVTRIGDHAFHCCSGLTSVTIPTGVTNVSDGVFAYCSGLTSVTIPSSAESIDSYAFLNCSGLASVTIPSSVTRIDGHAFVGCSGLVEILVAAGNNHYTSVNGVLFNKAKTVIVAYPGGKSGRQYAIPSSVTRIGEYAFANCEELTGILIPSSVMSIGEGAFQECEVLETIHVAKDDSQRVREMLNASYSGTCGVRFIANFDPMLGSGAGEEEAFKHVHTFNGLVLNEFGMCGMIQVATARKSAKGEVKVSGFVMLEDGKKQTLKAVSGKVSGGAVAVTTKVGKTELSLTIMDDGFTGTFGDMVVASAEIGEERGIISGTLKMSYFDAKTGKVKTKNITIKGLSNGEAAYISATVKGQGEKFFRAEIIE